MTIRYFTENDAQETSRVIAQTLRTCNIKDYSLEYVEENVRSHCADVLIDRAKEGHFYVVLDDDRIIGCGGISGYWGSLTESILLSIFVLPEYQSRGIGREIIRTLESDEYFLRADRVEIPASITACEFYKKCGYVYKDKKPVVDEEGCIRLEKRRLV